MVEKVIPKWKTGKEKLVVLELTGIDVNVTKTYEEEEVKEISINDFMLLTENEDNKVRYAPVKYHQETSVVDGVTLIETHKRKILNTEIDEFFPDFRDLQKAIKKENSVKIQLVVQPNTRLEDNKTFFKTFFKHIKALDIIKD